MGKPSEAQRKTLVYARVSTAARKDDLVRQKERLELFCAARGWQCITLTDIGSGLNYPPVAGIASLLLFLIGL